MEQGKKSIETRVHGPDPKDIGFNEYGGYTYKAIGEIMGMSPARVHQILIRSLKKLSKIATPLTEFECSK